MVQGEPWGLHGFFSTFRLACSNLRQENEEVWRCSSLSNLVLVIYFINSGVFMFLQNCLRVPGYPKMNNFSYPVPEKNENANLIEECSIPI